MLHRSADGKWLHVQLVNYRGWLRADDVALAADRQNWQARRELPFVVITGTKVVPRDAVMGKPVLPHNLLIEIKAVGVTTLTKKNSFYHYNK